uniref:3'-5' exonuclease domain-containing protein n=1 Tax=Lotharella oceanica TaxID=641309 RepID=A0A7S2U4F1_9EUKA|mmetsp:Transcript_8083/g.15883  ORF Transcript_8083/g.15883 Transcript_8083/m.15883 type:complete len:215 (+) Transcript_8083:186-830(+)
MVKSIRDIINKVNNNNNNEKKKNDKKNNMSKTTNKVLVGFDAEWPPKYDGSKTRVSLVQLAIETQVWLVDVRLLEELEEEEEDSRRLVPTGLLLDQVLTHVMTSNQFVKIGHGVRIDIKECRRSYPRAKCFASGSAGKNVVELTAMWKNSKRNRGDPIPASLSDMAQKILKKPLDKSCAMSDWGRRPLSNAQVHYAALDAHVALKIAEGLSYYP